MTTVIEYNGSTGRLEADGIDLHCGDCIIVCIGGKWVSDRLEMDSSDRWYLVGHPGIAPLGLEIDIP